MALVSGWPADRAELLHEAALLHDVGKIGVSDAILLKPGPLTPAERLAVTRHAALGAEIVSGVLTAEQVSWIRGHHERWDGNGYPDGLGGDAISAGASLLAIADAWDAMTGPRSYRAERAPDEAIEECLRERGRQFGPAAVDALMHVLRDPDHETGWSRVPGSLAQT
jgi:HD-GYP domain-containing protein (c-di-GMP phosphodiesterase class II)